MPVTASAIAEFLETPLHGNDVEIVGAATLSAPRPNHIVFAKRYSDEAVTKLNSAGALLALVVPEFAGQLVIPHLVLDNPRAAYARAAARFLAKRPPARIHPTAVLGEGVSVGERVSIGPYCVIGDGVVIGDDTSLYAHVVVADHTVIGRRCTVKSGAILGEEGFGIERGEDGATFRLPHLGGLHIGDDVEIGSCTTINRGTIDDTVVENGAKIDDLVYIAHNSRIGANTIIVGTAEISGSVKVGRGCWIGPGATVINSAVIGDGAMVGIGSSVVKHVAAGMVVSGHPARALRERTPEDWG